MYKELENYLRQIMPSDKDAKKLANARNDSLAKPPHSLGGLEEIAVKIAGITGSVCNSIGINNMTGADNSLNSSKGKCRVIVMCADNGVCEEGVSSAPISVTAMQAVNMTRYKTGMSSMAKHFGDEVEVVDVGIATPYNCDLIINRRIASGTRNLHKEPAMSRDEVISAIKIGIERAKVASNDGISIIGIGEMGIGNTTTSSAILSVLTGLNVSEVTGKGGGLTDEAFARKKKIIEEAIKLHAPNKNDIIDVLSKVGGLDIAAMCGAFLGAAIYKIPVVIDGFISVTAALCAAMISPCVTDYMFPSHVSFEPGYKKAIELLSLKPYLTLDMRLGEGSGCVLAFRIIEAALAMISGMALFGEESAIDDGYLAEIRQGDNI